MGLTDAIRSKRTLVAVGSGGVGKTTVSAALALRAAMEGQRVLVLTVDPARRLANALGLASFSEELRRIDDTMLRKAGLTVKGTLDAAMLDTKSTFDRVVTRYAPDEETRRRILANPFYRQASSALAGTQEYMAMEKLYQVREEEGDRYDTIILDTPPSQHALDFLSAPGRMQGLVDSRAFRAFMSSIRAAGWLPLGAGRLNRFILKGVGRFLGTDVFLDILTFLESFSSMYEGFTERSRKVENLLRSPDLGFLVVTSPEAAAVDEALFLRNMLIDGQMPFVGFIVNRVNVQLVEDEAEAVAARLTSAMADEQALGLYSPEIVQRTARKVIHHFEQLEAVIHKDERNVATLRAAAGPEKVFAVPQFPEDVHDLKGLYRFSSELFADEAGGAPLVAADVASC